MFTPIKTAGGFRIIDPGGDWLWGPKYWAREERGGVTLFACIHCGRNTGTQRNTQGVCVSGGGGTIVHPDDYDDYPHLGGEMGWFPVGRECIKRIPAEFRAPSPYVTEASRA